MGDPTKLKLEELRKSFPSLDDFSKEKLLGGLGPISEATLETVFFGPGGDPGAPIFTPSAHGYSGGPPIASGGGSDYFGGTTENDWGEMHDGGWGDDGPGGDPGGDSNPGGSEGGNGQNSSGNPGTQQDAPPWQGPEPPRTNNMIPTTRPYDLKNYSDNPVMIQYGPYGTPPIIVQPGGQFTAPAGVGWEIDGVNINGYTFKLTDGFNFVEIYNSHWETWYWFQWTALGYYISGGLLEELPPDDDGNPDQNWFQIFHWSP